MEHSEGQSWHKDSSAGWLPDKSFSSRKKHRQEEKAQQLPIKEADSPSPPVCLLIFRKMNRKHACTKKRNSLTPIMSLAVSSTANTCSVLQRKEAAQLLPCCCENHEQGNLKEMGFLIGLMVLEDQSP